MDYLNKVLWLSDTNRFKVVRDSIRAGAGFAPLKFVGLPSMKLYIAQADSNASGIKIIAMPECTLVQKFLLFIAVVIMSSCYNGTKLTVRPCIKVIICDLFSIKRNA